MQETEYLELNKNRIEKALYLRGTKNSQKN